MKQKFSDYNFKPSINETLQKINFNEPTPIQSKVIPLLNKKANVVGISRTGSGKTHAFLLPILNNVNPEEKMLQAIIIVPTRELATQIFDNLKVFLKDMPKLQAQLAVGGKESNPAQLSKAQIIVGTPGRMTSLLTGDEPLNVSRVDFVVIDEADMIFDLDFINDIDQILSNVKDTAAFAVFSATITQDMHPFLQKYFSGVKIIEIKDGLSNIKHILVANKKQDRYVTLKNIISTIDPYVCLIFASKKSDVDEYAQRLNEDGIKCLPLHGDLQPRERARTLKRINNLEVHYVVASDIASRGIDIEGVSHVISIDLPKELEYYIHRAGRTGRYQYDGISYVIYDPSDEPKIARLEEKGIKFSYQEYDNGELVEAGYRDRTQKKRQSDNYSSAALNKVANKKKPVKPGYKKKRKLALEKIKKKERQQEIKARIKKQRKQRKNDSRSNDV